MKIGILTHYYNTHNYGGLLQAYALTAFLRKNKVDAQQICYTFYDYDSIAEDPFGKDKSDIGSYEQKTITLPDSGSYTRMIEKLKRIIVPYKNKIKRFIEFPYTRKLDARYNKLRMFQEKIPHSNKIYDKKSIYTANDAYDGFIVGSDQVWNFDYFNRAFFLEFANSEKKKISYAASSGGAEISETQQVYLRRVLEKFDAISVREADLKETIQRYTKKQVEYVLDPVFLLEREDWDAFSSKCNVRSPYVFCYFLTEDEKQRNIATGFAKNLNLPIVTIPYLGGRKNSSDSNFDSIRIASPSPYDFVSLIKNAEFILTDSFHATAFSLIFEKQFFIFENANAESMNSRIESLLSIVHSNNRFCCAEKKTLEYILAQEPLNYNSSGRNIDYFKSVSKDFLLSNLQ